MKKWVEELIANGPKDIVLAIVGNKIDLCDNEEVNYATGKEFATSLGALFKLVSAKEGKNIEVTRIPPRNSLTLLDKLPSAIWQTANSSSDRNWSIRRSPRNRCAADIYDD